MPSVSHDVVGDEQHLLVFPPHGRLRSSQSGQRPQAPPWQKYQVDLSRASNGLSPQKVVWLSGLPAQKGAGVVVVVGVVQVPSWQAPPGAHSADVQQPVLGMQRFPHFFVPALHFFFFLRFLASPGVAARPSAAPTPSRARREEACATSRER